MVAAKMSSHRGGHQDEFDDDLRSETSRYSNRSTRSSSRRDQSMRQAVEQLMDERTRLKSDLKRLNTKVRGLTEELDTTQAYYKGQVTSLLDERDELADQLEHVRQQLDNAHNDVSTKIANEKRRLEARTENVRAETRRLTAQNEILQEQVKNFESEREQMRTMFESQLEARESVYKQQAEQAAERAKAADADSCIQRAEAQRIAVERDFRLDQLMTEKKRAEEAVVKMQQEVEQKLNTAAREKTLALTELQYQINTMEQDKTNQLNAMKAAQERVKTAMEAELTRVRAELSENVADKRVKEMDMEISRLNSIVKQQSDIAERLKAENGSIKKQFVTNLNKQQQDAEAAVSDRDQIIKDMENEARAYHAESAMRLKNAHNEGDTLRQEIASLKEQINSKEGEIQRLNLEMSHMRNQYETSFKNDLMQRVNSERLIAERNAEKEYTDKLAVMQNELNDTKLKARYLEHQVAIINRESEAKLAELAQTHKFALHDAQKQVSAQIKETENVKRMVAISQREHSDQIAQVKRETSAKMSDQLSEHMAKIKDLEQQLKARAKEHEEHRMAAIEIEKRREARADENMAKVRKECDENMQRVNEERDALLGKITILEERVKTVKKDFLNKLNDQTLKNEAKKQELKSELEETVKAKDEEIASLSNTIAAKREDFIVRMNAASESTKQLKADLEEAQREARERTTKASQLATQLKSMETESGQKITKLTEEKKTLQAALDKARTDIEVKDALLVDAKGAPNASEKMRKVRDDCLTTMKKQRIACDEATTRAESLQIELENTKQELATKTRDLEHSTRTHAEVKDSFVQNLNNQREMYETALAEKTQLLDQQSERIMELEKLTATAMHKIVDN